MVRPWQVTLACTAPHARLTCYRRPPRAARRPEPWSLPHPRGRTRSCESRTKGGASRYNLEAKGGTGSKSRTMGRPRSTRAPRNRVRSQDGATGKERAGHNGLIENFPTQLASFGRAHFFPLCDRTDLRAGRDPLPTLRVSVLTLFLFACDSNAAAAHSTESRAPSPMPPML